MSKEEGDQYWRNYVQSGKATRQQGAMMTIGDWGKAVNQLGHAPMKIAQVDELYPGACPECESVDTHNLGCSRKSE